MINILESYIIYNNPLTSEATQNVASHYAGRRVVCSQDGQKIEIYLNKNELPFRATSEQILKSVKNNLEIEGV